jgi:uncharacterized membrane protein YkvA (DUF1232 family)
MRTAKKYFGWVVRIKEPYALFLLLLDKRIPVRTRLYAGSLMALVLGLLLDPFDFIPGVPLIGFAIDLVLIPVVMSLIGKWIPENILSENRKKANSRVNRILLFILLGLIILSIILAAALGTGIFLIVRAIRG